MASKTITIGLDAYKKLRKWKRADESLTETINRIVPEPFDLDRWLKKVRRNGLSEEAAEAIEQHVATRRIRSRPRR